MLMKCDECGTVQEAGIKQKRSYGIYHAYVECNVCYVRTTSFVTDETTRNRIEELKRLRENNENRSKQAKLERKIDKRMNMLKDKYGY